MIETRAVNNITILKNPLVEHNMAVLRDKNTSCEAFRAALKRISYALFLEAAKNLPTKTIKVQTPIIECENEVIDPDIDVIISPILRAGLAFSETAQQMFPFAKIHHLGMYRNEETLEPVWYYNKLKGKIENPEKTYVFVLDPMLATGNSAYDAVLNYVNQGIKEENIVFVCLISAPIGLEKLSNSFKKIKIVTSKLDSNLNSNGYIVPGLGDAGDRIFNTV